MTQFKPMRTGLGIFAETVGRETLFSPEFLNWECVNSQLLRAIYDTTWGEPAQERSQIQKKSELRDGERFLKMASVSLDSAMPAHSLSTPGFFSHLNQLKVVSITCHRSPK